MGKTLDLSISAGVCIGIGKWAASVVFIRVVGYTQDVHQALIGVWILGAEVPVCIIGVGVLGCDRPGLCGVVYDRNKTKVRIKRWLKAGDSTSAQEQTVILPKVCMYQ
jgi:hypothetical protein